MRRTALLIVWLLTLAGSTAYAQQGTSPHGVLTIDSDCNACHRTEAWAPLREAMAFSHNMQTDFPLTGSHQRVNCASCHIDLRFDEPHVAATECATCHLDVHQGAYSQNCADCHNTTLFQDVEGIGVHARTSFPLTGTHAQLTCVTCHTDDVGGAFTSLESTCESCHQDDYDHATSLDHVAAGFPLTCETCHNTVNWQGTLFDHQLASNGFVLLGAHEQEPCSACHRSPDLTPIFAAQNDQDCISCHQPDYTDEHAGSGFPTTCLECHSTETWDGATFDHVLASEGFALIGAHDALACETCHSMPDLTPLFTPANDQDCITCHQQDYSDEHTGTGFPNTCLDCHNTTTWDGATFDHDDLYFPIYSGNHRGEWSNNCQSCHLQPANYASFSCEGACHEHTKAKMDNEHQGENGYTFDFPLCLNCHPNGN
ncbi:MAG: cytochrome c3 family protein [Rhodothermales bacterium]|nr:cytochrome c3 family protein [Rhodothermales bacterium]